MVESLHSISTFRRYDHFTTATLGATRSETWHDTSTPESVQFIDTVQDTFCSSRPSRPQSEMVCLRPDGL